MEYEKETRTSGKVQVPDKIEKTKYRYVSKITSLKGTSRERIGYITMITGNRMRFEGENAERDCAIFVDKIRIQQGKKPVNILKPKV